MTHIVRKTTNKLNRNDNTTYQTREHWKLLNSNENTNQSCTRPSGSCRIGLYFHSRSTISNTHSFGMRYYTIEVYVVQFCILLRFDGIFFQFSETIQNLEIQFHSGKRTEY